ncbi:MAG: hypothetical protein IJI24_10010 [Lachnospiraceae bacterium]|nr:hypothetical protein [Lachnospiraceae bacterium]
MLRKLLKYELLATSRVMLPLFLALICATAALGFNIRYNSNTNNSWILSLIVIFLFVAAILAVSVVSILLVLMRFHRNLLGEEGYLMFTLPVTTLENLLGKVLCTAIWIIAALLVGCICGGLLVFILGGWNEFLAEVRQIWSTLSETLLHARTFFILALGVGFISILESIVKVYAAIATGHQWGEHRILGSVIAYMVFGTVEIILSAVFNLPKILSDIETVEYSETVVNGMQLSFMSPKSLLVPTIIALIGLAVYGSLAWYMLDRRLNLE